MEKAGVANRSGIVVDGCDENEDYTEAAVGGELLTSITSVVCSWFTNIAQLRFARQFSRDSLNDPDQ